MGRIANIGIEKIRVYPTALRLDLSLLAAKRGYDTNHLHQELMVYERGINPLWEDPVTMAVNAAKPMLSEEDIASIGMLIVGTETGLDQEKSLSSWVLNYLNLPDTCRHFEIKSACYSGTAALKMASSWLLSGTARPGQKALVITTDQSLKSIGEPWEYINGAGAVALLVSEKPGFLRIEHKKFGIYAHEISDVIRPLPWIETGNSDQSLYAYMESLTASYDDYVANVGPIDFAQYFKFNIYHVPFSGISFRAHKRLMTLGSDYGREEIIEDFNVRTQPGIQYTKKIGSTYGGSVFIALLSLIKHAENVQAGDRVGIFSYGSGSCAEFYSGVVGDKALQVAEKAELDKLLEARYELSVEQYEQLENSRAEMYKNADFLPDRSSIPGLFETNYKGKELLVYNGSKGYYRRYEFS